MYGATVTVFNDANHNGHIDAGEVLGTATVSANVFSAPLNLDGGLPAGAYNFSVIETDVAGNNSTLASAPTIIVGGRSAASSEPPHREIS